METTGKSLIISFLFSCVESCYGLVMLMAVSSVECFAMWSVLLSWEEGQESALGRVVSLVLLFSWLWIHAGCVLTLVHGHVRVWKPELPPCCYKAKKIFLFNLPWYNIIKTISLAIFLGVPSELFTQRLAGRDKRLIQRRETLGGAKNLNSS